MSAPESSKTHPAPTVIRDEIQTSADSPASPPSDMPPPAHVIVFSPPPPATFTVKQILDYPLLTPSPPSGASVNIAASKATRPTHNSSARALLHQPIHPHSLSAISAFNISAFRHRLKSMESIRFNDPMSLVWEASPMLSEGCVTGYLDAQVLGAAWQAVLQMVPKDRDYDLEMVKQVPAMEGIPDQTYSVLRGDTRRTLAVVELKSAGVIKAMLPVIHNTAPGSIMDATDDWNSITRQLRMYAVGGQVRNILAMDEGVGIYFQFPLNPASDDEPHLYLYASTDLGQSFDGELRLSLRELVVYTLFSAFDSNDIELRDFTAQLPSPLLAGPNTRPYKSVLPNQPPLPTPDMKRRAGPCTEMRRQSKRGKGNDLAPQESIDKMVVGSTIKLELIPGKTPLLTVRPRASSLDSGFHDGTENSPPKPATGVRAAPAAAATVTVERILKTHVALVTDGTTRFIAKLFPPYTTQDPERLLTNELAAYTQCAALQGTYIPYLFGVYRAVKRGGHSSPIMLTEYIASGTTVADLVALAGELDDDDELVRAEAQLARLLDSAVDAVTRMHAVAVVHGDLDPSNVLVCADRVVLVDFGYSAVVADAPRRVRTRRMDDDLKRLRKAFNVGEW